MNRVTLEDIAKRAGVTKTTVSCALRNKPGVSEENRERIRKLAVEMGYQVNPMISSLMHQLRTGSPVAQTENLAFLHSSHLGEDWRKQPFLEQLHQGAAERAAELGFSVDPLWVPDTPLRGRRLTDILKARGMLGVLVAPVRKAPGSVHLDWTPFANAAIGFSLYRPRLHRACAHHYHSMVLACRELRKLGYRRIGVVVSPHRDARFDYAWQAGLGVLSSVYGSSAPAILKQESLDVSGVMNWCDRHRLQAIISAGYPRLGPALGDRGIRIPEDLGWVSMEAHGLEKGTATVRRDWRRISAAAVDLVAEQLIRNERGIPEKAKTVLIEGEWFPGATVRDVK